jgi:hypothetical protein
MRKEKEKKSGREPTHGQKKINELEKDTWRELP